MRGLATVAIVIACAIAVVACGASGDSPAAATSSLANAELNVSKCMRAHGLRSFPDPTSAGGGFNLNGTRIDPQSSLFQSAQRTCFKLLPGGGPGAQKPTAQRMAQALAVSECMRRHGISGFPDPTTTPPPIANHAAYSSVDDNDGIIFAIPRAIDPTSSTFKQAASACGF